ncbi:MAG: ATP-binding protein [Rhodobacteraceae bacterium]|nr:ATP-binding protein [Paracoccaceae bacterium]
MDESTAALILSGLPLPALVVAGLRVTMANAQAERLLGPAAGRPAAAILRNPAFLSGLEAAARSGRHEERRLELSRPGGETLRLAAHMAPLATDAAGQPIVLVTFVDLTGIEAAEEIRRDFVANVSHELRTPLTAVLGLIETLRSAARNDPAARDRFLAVMEREAQRMIRLVSDLLSLSRVEAEERIRPSDPVDLCAVIGSVTTTMRGQAEAAGVALLTEGTGTPVIVPGDADQLQQVFQNLVENALRYAAGGREVRLAIERLAHEPVIRGPAVAVSVSDRGEGIDPIHLPRLTERFYRADAHRSREKGGTGLGLAIVKHIVNRHRGRLRIESEAGKGSRFTVILPAG